MLNIFFYLSPLLHRNCPCVVLDNFMRVRIYFISKKSWHCFTCSLIIMEVLDENARRTKSWKLWTYFRDFFQDVECDSILLMRHLCIFYNLSRGAFYRILQLMLLVIIIIIINYLSLCFICSFFYIWSHIIWQNSHLFNSIFFKRN